jgi:hypothetical protein
MQADGSCPNGWVETLRRKMATPRNTGRQRGSWGRYIDNMGFIVTVSEKVAVMATPLINTSRCKTHSMAVRVCTCPITYKHEVIDTGCRH